MSNTEHLLNLTSVFQDTLSFGVSGLKEYLYITAISGSVSVLAFCALLMLYMFPKLAHFRVVGLLLRLSVLLGAVNSLVAFMLMPPLATALTITVICVYSIFFAAFLLSFLAKGWRMIYTWYMLGFAASVKTKYLIRPTGTDDWLPYNDHEGELFTIRITNGKYWIFTTKYDLGGKFEGKALTLQNKPGDAVGLKLALDKWDGSSKTKIYYRGSATAGKSAFLFFGDTSATV